MNSRPLAGTLPDWRQGFHHFPNHPLKLVQMHESQGRFIFGLMAKSSPVFACRFLLQM